MVLLAKEVYHLDRGATAFVSLSLFENSIDLWLTAGDIDQAAKFSIIGLVLYYDPDTIT